MNNSEKVRENKIRRMAGRQGLRLEKSKRRDPHALDYGMYMLVDIQTNGVVLGSGPVGPNADLDDIEKYLTSS